MLDFNEYFKIYETSGVLNETVLSISEDYAFDNFGVDYPSVFLHNGKYYMLYGAVDEEDNYAPQTGLAISDDLLNWEKLGCILQRDLNCEPKNIGRVGRWILQDVDLYGNRALKKVNGKYVMIYHQYSEINHSRQLDSIGIAFTDDESLMNWQCEETPIFIKNETIDWECGGEIKIQSFLEYNGKYYIFYSSFDKSTMSQIGIAVSDDLYHWKRYDKNPISAVSGRSSFPQEYQMCISVMYDSRNENWLMFYNGSDTHYHLRIGIACSKDLYNWEKYSEKEFSNYYYEPKENMNLFYKDGHLYHFHQSLDIEENRCIELSTIQQV